MLKSLSYLNIVFAIIYFVCYLMNSYSWPILAMLLIIVYSGLVLRNLEKEVRFTAVHYVPGTFCLIFAGFLTLWTVNIVRSSITHDYFGDTWMYISITVPFILSIIGQYILLLLSRRAV